jgi:hypothetical protein
MKKTLLVAGLVVLGMAGVARANLIQNGSFEAQHVDVWKIYDYTNGNDLQGWDLVSGSGIEVQHAYYTPYAGGGPQYVELDSYDNSKMAQTVTTTLGEKYSLSFAYSPRPGVPGDSNNIELYWNDFLISTQSAAGGSLTSWSLLSFTVYGTGSDTLSFAAAGTSDKLGGLIDDVKLEAAPVPIPSAVLLFGTGLASLIGLRRRKTEE